MLRISQFIAQTTQPYYREPYLGPEPRSLGQGVLYVIVYAVLGIALTALGFKVFDWIMPKIDVEVELKEKQSLPVAIVMAAVILGISAVIVAALVG